MTVSYATEAVGATGRGRLPSWRHLPRLIGVVSVLVVLGVWWLITDATGAMNPKLLAGPVRVAKALVDLTLHPFAMSTLPQHAAASLERWGYGFAIAVLLGVPLGALFAWYADVRSAINPMFETLRYIPPFAWVPLAILWLGASTSASATVVFIAAFPPCVINTQRGLATIDPIIIQAARTSGASSLAILRSIALPTATPAITAGIRIAVSNGWMALMGAELIVGRTGLGFLINAGQENGAPEVIIAGMIVIGVIGYVLDLLLQLGMRPLNQWRKGIESGD